MEINGNFIYLDQLMLGVDIRFPLGWHDSQAEEPTHSLTSTDTKQRESADLSHEVKSLFCSVGLLAHQLSESTHLTKSPNAHQDLR